MPDHRSRPAHHLLPDNDHVTLPRSKNERHTDVLTGVRKHTTLARMAFSSQASSPRTRERDLVHATRALFDERGMQDAPIEDIARAVGIARGLIYRHFSSKEELFVLTVTDYLRELD